jgi:opacity protein-like surface antigen
MKRSIVIAACAALGVFAGAGTVRAQLPGIPVYNTVVPAGFTIAADVAFPSSSTHLGTSFAGTGAFGTGRFGFTLSIGATSVKADTVSLTQATIGGTVNWKVFGGPLIPLAVNLQAGVAYWEFGDPDSNFVAGGTEKIENFHVPVGVSFVLTIPTPGMAIKPWIAPRVDYSRTTLDGLSSDATEFAFSIGLDLAFLNGLGVRAAYDWMKSDGSTLSTIGVGLNYSFKTLSY